MMTNYYTLAALCRELDAMLRDKSIAEIFSQQKEELILAFKQEQSLIVSVSPSMNYCCVRERYSRAKKNSVDLFSSLVGATISEISISPNDRIIFLKTYASLTLHLMLYNTAASNILLVDENGTVVEAFKRNKELKGTTLQTPVRAEKFVYTNETFQKALQQFSSLPVLSALKKIFPLLGSVLIREALHRGGIKENVNVSELGQDDYAQMAKHVEAIIKSVHHPKPTIYYQNNQPTLLSITPLEHLANHESKTFLTVNEAVQKFVVQQSSVEQKENIKNLMLGKLTTQREQLRRLLEKATAVSAEGNRAEEYARSGTMIMANLQQLTKGMTEIELQDLYTPEKTCRIKLDPKLTPAQNAEVYFEKAKKAKRAREESAQRVEEFKKKIALVETMIEKLEHCSTEEEVKEFIHTFQNELRSFKISSETKEEAPLPFRVFTVFGGYEVWVGKSSASNDELTTKYAKPNDYWFHVRGAGGSHTVLKVKSKTQPPPKEAITQAARIAAYYSKMRKASNVPVAYCKRKYVHKKKGAPEGTVFLEREEVIFVEPALP